jgi:hypothetical protein
MAQLSFPWPGDSGAGGTGDCGPYTADAFSNWYEKMFCSDSTNESVISNIGNELAVTGAATPLSINTGSALVNGKFYNNSASTTLAIATPAGATRIDRVILRADYAAQTVRLVLLAGAEGGAAPALTQTDGTTWEVSLAQASITTGGVVTLTDERVFLHFNSDIETAMIEADAVTVAKIPNRTRTLFVKGYGYNFSDNIALVDNTSKGWTMTDAKICDLLAQVRLPSDYASGLTVKAVVNAAATGNCYCSNTVNVGKAGQVYSTHADSFTIQAVSLTQDLITEIALVTPSALEAGDYLHMDFTRTGNDGSDTVNAVVYALGFLVSYTADS